MLEWNLKEKVEISFIFQAHPLKQNWLFSHTNSHTNDSFEFDSKLKASKANIWV